MYHKANQETGLVWATPVLSSLFYVAFRTEDAEHMPGWPETGCGFMFCLGQMNNGTYNMNRGPSRSDDTPVWVTPVSPHDPLQGKHVPNSDWSKETWNQSLPGNYHGNYWKRGAHYLVRCRPGAAGATANRPPQRKTGTGKPALSDGKIQTSEDAERVSGSSYA